MHRAKRQHSGAPTCSRLYARDDAESRLKIGAPNRKVSRNPSESRILAKILPRMARMARISLEQKGTKGTKEEFFFVAFVCFCGNCLPMGALMESS